MSFTGKGVDSPNFGPDSAIRGVRNFQRTPDGKFKIEIAPGDYDIIISRGPEFDAIAKTISVEAGEVTEIKEQLERTVDTTGWISTASMTTAAPRATTRRAAGRVLNLLVDHLEFIPCTEHQRIASYAEHLEYFGATDRVLTCTGMELTGGPLPSIIRMFSHSSNIATHKMVADRPRMSTPKSKSNGSRCGMITATRSCRSTTLTSLK